MKCTFGGQNGNYVNAQGDKCRFSEANCPILGGRTGGANCPILEGVLATDDAGDLQQASWLLASDVEYVVPQSLARCLGEAVRHQMEMGARPFGGLQHQAVEERR